MPIYEITSPDGKTYEVTAPEGATQDQVLAYVQQQAAAAPKPAHVPGTFNPDWHPQHISPEQLRAHAAEYSAAHPVTDEMSGYEKFAAGWGKSYVDTGRGLQQIGGSIMDAIAPKQAGVADLVGGSRPSHNDDVNARINDSRKTDAALMDTGAGWLGNITGQAVQIATPLPGAAAAKGTQVLGKAAPYAAAAARGATFNAAQGVADGESRGLNTALGGLLGAGGQALPKVLGAGANKLAKAVDSEVGKAINYLKSLGVPLHLSQAMDSGFLRLVGSVANKLPFSGVQKAGRAQQQAFNRELGKMVGLDGVSKFTDDVMLTAKTRIGNAYDTLFARNRVKMTPEVAQDLQALGQRIDADLPPEAAQIVRNQVNKFLSKVDSKGEIAGRAYQNVRDTLFNLESAPGHGHLVREVRKVFERAAQRSFQGHDAVLLRIANERYSNLKTIEKALRQVAGAGGDVRPASLWPLVNTKFGAPKDMRELAQAGQLVLKDGVPDSGTSQRELVYRLLGLGGAGAFTGTLPLLAKGAAAGALVGRALNSPIAAKVIPGAGQKALRGAARATKPAGRIAPTAAPTLASWLLPQAAAAKDKR